MTEAGPLASALAFCRAGRFAQAEPVLRALVASSPANAEALQLMGIVASALGRVEESLAWFDRAKAARPDSTAFMQNRAHALLMLGRFPEARQEAQAMLALDANNADGRRMLAMITHEEGVVHHSAGRFGQAVDAYRAAIALGIGVPQVHSNLGNALKLAGREDEALAEFAEWARLQPESAVALAAYGGALNDAGRTAEAMAQLERALEIDADLDGARNDLGNALAAAGRRDEALAAFRAILARSPDDDTALSNMGAVLQDMGDFGAAREKFEAALRAHPDSARALNNLGYLAREEGRLDEASSLFERALAISPTHARAAYNLSLVRLAQGRFAEGWKLNEARFRTSPPAAMRRSFTVAGFAAEDFGGAHRTAVWREQGIGDQILYSTTLADLEARGESFALEADARLVPAMRRAHPRWTIASPDESVAAFAGCDRHAPLATMAGLLRPDAASFARQPRAFLLADPARASGYRARLASPARRVIGISWRSFQKKDRAYLEARKSAPLSAFAPLAAHQGFRLLDLQYGDTALERSRFQGELTRIDGLDLFNDLDGVLAAIEACDAVVTTSNVTAHLAGALGKQTFLIYLGGIPPFHYWAPDAEEKCRWYPSVRIVSGRGIDTWPRAIEQVVELLGR